MRNRLSTMDELLQLSDNNSCFDPRQQEQQMLSSPSRHRTRTRAIHASLRNKARVFSLMAAYIANVVLVWATWAVWRLRKSWADAIASTHRPEGLPYYTSTDLARFECPLVDEADPGPTLEPRCLEKNPPPSPALMPVVSEWQRPLQEPPTSVLGQGRNMMNSDVAGNEHHMIGIGIPSVVLSALSQTWPKSTTGNDLEKGTGDGGVVIPSPEASPSGCGVLVCGMEGGTAPASPESDRAARKSTIISSAAGAAEIVTSASAAAVLRSAGNTSSSCGLCGYTLEEGQEVVRSPACAQGFMVSAL